MGKKVTPQELLEIIAQGGKVDRLPSSLEEAIKGLREDLARHTEEKRKSDDELRSLLVQTIDKLATSGRVGDDELASKLSSMAAQNQPLSYRFEVERGSKGLIQGVVVTPRTTILN